VKKILILIALVSFLVFLATTNAGLIGGEQGGPSAASVLEPTKMLLIGAGLIGLAGYGRKKFKR
jgi:hypothetical protein